MTDRRSLSPRTRIQNVALRAAVGVGLVAGAVAATGDAHAQAAPQFPFPSGNTTAIRTGALTTLELRAQYEAWKTNFVRACPDGSARVAYPENEGEDTRSEGIGYGLVIAAYMGDQPTFDALYAYWQRFPAAGSLMNWRTFDCGGNSEAGSASDADVDAALALIVAEKQWGGYAGEANALIGAIRSNELLTCGNQRLLDPGSDGGFGGCGCMNPSYFAPAYYAAYATVDTANAALWNQTVGDAYTTFNAIQNPGTGLVPAWSSNNAVGTQGCNFQVAGGGNDNEYQSDAARVPWRVATDLAWTGSTAARTFLTRMLNWVNTGNRITHIADRFQLGGNALPPFDPNAGPENDVPLDNATLNADGRRSTIAMGAFASAGIVGTQEELDHLVGAWQSLYRAGDNVGEGGIDQPHAFNNSLALLYGMLATGTMWNPLGANPTPIAEPALVDQPGNLIQNGDFDEGVQGWSMELLSGTDAEGFAMHQNGEVHILIQKVAAAAGTEYSLRFKQQINIQAGQNYRVSIRARAAAPRTMQMFVGQRDEPYDQYLVLDDPETEGSGINLTTEMQTFSTVVAGAATTGFVQLALDFGASATEVIIDDVLIAPTTDPVTAPGTPIAEPPVTDPTAPGGGDPAAQPGGGDLGTIDPGGDATGGPGAPIPGGEVGGAPPPPAGSPPSATCTAANPAVCGAAPYACSIPLGLCYDTNTGYVRDPSTNSWSKPPYGVAGCASDQVYWPKYGFCYRPDTGWIFNTGTMSWEWYGVDYTEGQRPPGEDSGCAVSGAPAGRGGSSWMLLGLVGAVFGLASRRRSAR